MVKISIVSICFVLFFGCSNQEKSTKDTDPKLIFDRLIGTWKLSTEEQFEQWKKNSDGSYSSHMFSISGKDTSMLEEVKIVNDGGKWNFITLVKGQNNGKAITFTSAIIEDSLVQFENPAHDFPRLINYRLPSDTTMQAFIGGTTDTIYFNFSRVVGK